MASRFCLVWRHIFVTTPFAACWASCPVDLPKHRESWSRRETSLHTGSSGMCPPPLSAMPRCFWCAVVLCYVCPFPWLLSLTLFHCCLVLIQRKAIVFPLISTTKPGCQLGLAHSFSDFRLNLSSGDVAWFNIYNLINKQLSFADAGKNIPDELSNIFTVLFLLKSLGKWRHDRSSADCSELLSWRHFRYALLHWPLWPLYVQVCTDVFIILCTI